MTVVLTKVTVKGTPKTVGGQLLQDALDHLKVIITNVDGTRSIKKFKKSEYTYKVV